ncbi:hypothetical protein C2G38_2028634 [Gigaspora rosea]|uniref:Uncharacterized protein n=1 Tax=Gigaspora rosea TaxID=44941 RepID=A0A397W7N4_9GLOM|nr:hypothetical protein C2G38_2028634 [Gigaspora rosea]
MNNEDEQPPYKKWFKLLFNAFHNDETAIEFLNDSPPVNFIKIINTKEEQLIKILSFLSNITNVVVWYWNKKDEPKIINRAIEYIACNFKLDQNIVSTDLNERNRLENVKKKDKEWKMQKELVEKLNKDDTIFPGFRYLFKYNWVPADNIGANDLILTNGKGIFAIVETKRAKKTGRFFDKMKKKFVNTEPKIDKHKKSYAIYQAGVYKQKFIEQYKGTYKDKDDPSFDIIAVIGIGIGENNERWSFKPFDNQVCETLDRIHNKHVSVKSPTYKWSVNMSESSLSSVSSVNTNDGLS